MNRLILFLLILAIASCSNSNKGNIRDIENSLNINTGNNYKILVDSFEETGTDFIINMQLQFNDTGYEQMVKQISTSPFFNLKNNSLDSQKILHMLKERKLKGFWIETDTSYNFVDYNYVNEIERVDSYLDKKSQILYFTLAHV